MEYNVETIKLLYKKYQNFTSKLNYELDKDISYLLPIIILAFVLKYGLNNETLILKILTDIKINVSSIIDEQKLAYYKREIILINNKLFLKKEIVINKSKYKRTGSLLDSIIHEINHVINSYNNEIEEVDNLIYLRSGISYSIFKKENNKITLFKTSNKILEEVINSKQTEEIIDIINSFSKYNEFILEIDNILYSLNQEMKNNYKSNAYYLEKEIVKDLLNNKSFFVSISNFRLKGNIKDIYSWFDSITNKENSFIDLNNLLDNLYEKELDYSLTKFKILKNLKLIKIKNLINEIKKYTSLFTI